MGLAETHDSKVEAFLFTVGCVSLVPGFAPCSKQLGGRGQASDMAPPGGAFQKVQNQP